MQIVRPWAKPEPGSIGFIYQRLVSAEAPSRQLDAALAGLLPEEIRRARGRGGSRVCDMAFTRGVEQADRFVKLALPGWTWLVSGGGRNAEAFNCILWSPDHVDWDADGPTPALAMLKAAVLALIAARDP